jgi:MFS family permease
VASGRGAGRPVVPLARQTRTPTGLVLGAGVVVTVVAACVAAVVPASAQGWRFGIVAGAVGVFAAVTVDPLAVAGVAVLAWLVVNGFLVDRLGELSWHGRGDLVRAMILVLVGGLGLVVGDARLRRAEVRARGRLAAELRALVGDVGEEERRDA